MLSECSPQHRLSVFREPMRLREDLRMRELVVGGRREHRSANEQPLNPGAGGRERKDTERAGRGKKKATQ